MDYPDIKPDQRSPDYSDDANNSYEQMVALTTWVNVAVDMLNRGEPEAAILAKLSKDGCPDPQSVLERAIKQPFEEPEVQMPEPAPAPAPEAPPMSQEPAQRAAALDAKRGSVVRIGGTTGRMLGAYEEFGIVIARIATDEGHVDVDVDPDDIEVVEETRRDPLAEIQKYIDDMPAPDTEHKASMLAYAENLKTARAFVVEHIDGAGSSMERLAGIDEAIAKEQARVEQHIATMGSPDDDMYLASQNEYAAGTVVGSGGDSLDFDAFEVDEETPSDWDRAVHEESEILVHEAAIDQLAADTFLTYAATKVASAPTEVKSAFMANVSRHRDARLAAAAKSLKTASAELEVLDTDIDDAFIEAIFN